MTPIRRWATLCALLFATPLLLGPSASAGPVLPDRDVLGILGDTSALPGLGDVDTLSGDCSQPGPADQHGYIAITHLGAFPARGQWTDGCGGNGCDDEVKGKLYSNGKEYDFRVKEHHKDAGTCLVYCEYYDHVGWHRYQVHGFVEVRVPAPDGVKFGCGGRADQGGWIFGGCLETSPRYCTAGGEYPSITWDLGN